jgi:hypothetical protein
MQLLNHIVLVTFLDIFCEILSNFVCLISFISFVMVSDLYCHLFCVTSAHSYCSSDVIKQIPLQYVLLFWKEISFSNCDFEDAGRTKGENVFILLWNCVEVFSTYQLNLIFMVFTLRYLFAGYHAVY